MEPIIQSDGNGSTILKGRPHQWGIGAIITLVLFVVSVVFAAGANNERLKDVEDDYIKIEKRVSTMEETNKKLVSKADKLNIMVSLLCQKEGIKIPE